MSKEPNFYMEVVLLLFLWSSWLPAGINIPNTLYLQSSYLKT